MHSPCLHPGWHIAANRGILIILPLQSWLTALYFETNGNELTNSTIYVPPFSIIICFNYYCSNIRCTSKITTIPIHVGRARYLLVVYFSTTFHCAVSGILNPFNTSSASRHCVFTCSLYVYIYTMIHAMEFSKPGICPSYIENTYISVIGDIQTKR